MKGSALRGWDGKRKLDSQSLDNRFVRDLPDQFDQKMAALCRMASALQLAKEVALDSGIPSHDDKLIRLVASNKIIARLSSEGVPSPSDALAQLLAEFPHELRQDQESTITVLFSPPNKQL